MSFSNYFADANSDFEESEYVIFGIPYDKTSSFRMGAKKAPDEIRKYSWNFETFNLRNEVDFIDIKVHDHGNLQIDNYSIDKVIEEVESYTKKLLNKKKFPIAIGGEHSLTTGIVKAFEEDIAVVFFDAHLDYRNIYENEKYNHACVIRRISETIDINNIMVLGVRSAEKNEYIEAKNDGLFWISSYDIIKYGIKKYFSDFKKKINNKKIYLSLDIDVMDPCYAPGTGTPEPFGIKPFDLLEFIEYFSKDIIGFDVMEVCPPYDKGESSIIAAKFIKSVIEETSLIRNK